MKDRDIKKEVEALRADRNRLSKRVSAMVAGGKKRGIGRIKKAGNASQADRLIKSYQRMKKK